MYTSHFSSQSTILIMSIMSIIHVNHVYPVYHVYLVNCCWRQIYRHLVLFSLFPAKISLVFLVRSVSIWNFIVLSYGRKKGKIPLPKIRILYCKKGMDFFTSQWNKMWASIVVKVCFISLGSSDDESYGFYCGDWNETGDIKIMNNIVNCCLMASIKPLCNALTAHC